MDKRPFLVERICVHFTANTPQENIQKMVTMGIKGIKDTKAN